MKPFNQIICLLLVYLILASSSCRRVPPLPPRKADVYVCGVTYENSDTHLINPLCVYWKNGVQFVLIGPNKIFAPQHILVSGSDVYVAGGKTYFKNGINYTVPLQQDASIQYIAVSGNDVYITGDTYTGVTYWKNGTPVVISDSLGSSKGFTPKQVLQGMQIAASGQDVYFTAQEVDTSFPIPLGQPLNLISYWTNNVRDLFGNESILSWPTGITVSGQDVYVCGFTNQPANFNFDTVMLYTAPRAMYWKNGQPVYLGDGTADAITVSGNDVYVSGVSEYKPVYWKNGVKTVLSDTAYASGIAVSGNDVYVSGQQGEYAVYWKNGVVDTLGKGVALGITTGN